MSRSTAPVKRVHQGTRTVCCSILPFFEPVEAHVELNVVGALIEDLDRLFGRLNHLVVDRGNHVIRLDKPGERALAVDAEDDGTAPRFGDFDALRQFGIEGRELESENVIRPGARAVRAAEQPGRITRHVRRDGRLAERSFAVADGDHEFLLAAVAPDDHLGGLADGRTSKPC